MDVVAGDIGGTKCLLALVDERGAVSCEHRYESAKFARFELVVDQFLADVRAERGADMPTPARACFAVAGPVVNDKCQATNLPWWMDARDIERAAGIGKVRLVNDFHAQAMAVLALPASDLVEIFPGTSAPNGPIAILGAGTGLGEAFLFHAGGAYEVVASEGGHGDFAPTSERQIELLRYLTAKFGGHVSYERILSGRGLVNCYEFLRDRGYGREREAVRAALTAEDPAAVVSRFGLSGEDGLCDTAIDLFVEIYGQEAGNLALKLMATGGVYLCGGIAPRMLGRLQHGPFQAAYAGKGRLGALVRTIPVRVVTNARSGLLGAAVVAGRA